MLKQRLKLSAESKIDNNGDRLIVKIFNEKVDNETERPIHSNFE